MKTLFSPLNLAIMFVIALAVSVWQVLKPSTPEGVLAFVFSIPFALAIVLAWVLTVSRRSRLAWAMQNQEFTGTPTSRRQVILPNVAQFATPGQIIMVGLLPAVTLDSYQANIAGCTCLFNGSFFATVIARSANSPLVTAQVNPGDNLYYADGTLDAATNVRYGGSLDKNLANPFFGRLDPTQTKILAGVTNTAAGVVINGI